ncbi:cell division protein FtsQ/DivIB [Arthrobacter bambusae]|uniref:cell division protein FtsQ/DivIB n=1 Tax=Arthrobacter bambusae TaxID=1338426 RepID=UPI00278AEBC8|nr:cell division protein FtsQ/DivIB [Arthrobacter bambusae]MDQ0032049.1 cell division protein FtsQ [Arthrobacter bambusae]MDQ0100199.1 cell division protein FtsQ [Arthrobacter bambusae]
MADTRKPTFKPHAGTRQGVVSAERGLGDPVGGPSAATGGKDSNVLAFPEPKGRKQRRTVLTVLAIVVALVAGIIVAAVYSPVFAVRKVTVDGTKLLQAGSVQKALEPVKGKPLPQIDDAEIAALLKPLVQVRSVSTEARPPSELLVHIVERVPVALVKSGDNYSLVDVDGVQLGSTADPASAALPVIDGQGANQNLFKAITAVLATLPADVLAKMASASATSPDAVELKLTDGKTVVWGNADEKELKARVLEALLKAPANPKVPVNVYDVSAPRHPFTK